jgi:hypothetical protein
MRDLRKYWQEVRAIEKSLPECVWLMSLGDPPRGQTGGCMAQAAAAAAARLLHAKSHRLAAEEEIRAHQAAQEEAKRVAFHAGLRKRGIAVIAVPGGAERSSGFTMNPAPRSNGGR